MEAGEEGLEDAVLNIHKDAWINSLLPPFLCPNNPGRSIISNYLQTSLGTRESQEALNQLLLERLLNDALLMMDQ